MELGPLKRLFQSAPKTDGRAEGVESASEKSQKFAEEASFFFAFFRQRPLRMLPDLPRMLILYREKLKSRKRKVRKNEPSDSTRQGAGEEETNDHQY